MAEITETKSTENNTTETNETETNTGETNTGESNTGESKAGEIKPDGKKPGDNAEKSELNNRVLEALKSVYDPEIPVNIYELGLIYSVNIDDNSKVDIEMTLTSPACPVAGSLPPEVEGKVRSIPGVNECSVKVVWEPPWGMNMMSEEAKLQLNLL